MKGASWADATAAEEEEMQRREEGARQQRDAQRAPQSSPRQSQSQQPQQSPTRAAQQSYSGRAGGSNPPMQGSGYGGRGQDSRTQQDSRGGSQDSRGAGGYGGNQRSGGGQQGYGGGNRDYGGQQQQQPQRQSRDARDSRDGGGARGESGQQWARGEQPRGGPAAGGRMQQQSQLKASESLSDGTEQGIMGQLKEQFGFIQCADRDGDMFVHFSDITGGGHNVRRGDEVQFRVATDSRDGRTRALQVEVLPRGTVQMERVLEQEVRGVMTKELMGQYKPDRRDRRPKASLADSLAQGRQEAYGAKIRRMDSSAPESGAAASTADAAATPAASGSVDAAAGAPAAAPSSDVYEFSERDLVDPNVVLQVGDVLSFNIFEERKSKRRGATKVQLIEPNPQGRERGTVVSIKDNFGFIQPEEQFDDEEAAPPQQQQQGGRNPHYQSKDQQLFFHFSELMNPQRPPAVGDELSYRIDRSPAEGGKVSAQRIFALPKGSLNSREVGKDTVQGTVIKEITYETQQQQQQQQAKEAAAAAKEAAAAAAAAEPATAAAPDASGASADPVNPLQRDAPAAASSGGSSRSRASKVVPGLISYTDASGVTVELPFRPSDVSGQGRAMPLILKGDTASFRILTLRTRAGVSRRATNVSVHPSGWGAQGREQGVVSSVKEGFAFVDSTARSEKVFLHSSQLPRAADKKDENPRERRVVPEGLFVGLEVEFNAAQTEPGKFAATRVTVLPQGSVQFDELLPYTLTGVVSRSIKIRDATPAAPKDGSSFSKNDLRRDQAAHPQGGREGKGEKGEIKKLAFSGENAPQSGEVTLPKEGVPFYDLDVMAPAAANLDTTALIVGDVVTLQLKRHKQSKRLSAANVQLQQMNPTQREKGQVTRINEHEGLGYLSLATRTQPLAFFLTAAPKSASGAALQVGDCFEFNISEANAGSKKERAQRRDQQHEEAVQAHAVRLTPLERGAVGELESVDRTRRLRGFISQMPEKSSAAQGKGGKAASKQPGQIIVLPMDRAPAVTDPALSHPGSWYLEPSAAWAVYSAAGIHAASITTELAKIEGEEKYPFTLRDLSLSSYLNKGDLLDFYLSVRTQPTVIKRAVEFALVPLQGTVDKVEVDRASGGKAYTGVITVYNPQAARSEEAFVFSSQDVVGEGPLSVGDFVSFSDVVFNAEQKKRQAKGIVRTKDSRPAEMRLNVKRRPAGAPIIVASRFARGPDKEGIGFAPRKGRQPAASASPPPAQQQ